MSEPERVIHNGVIIDEVPGVITDSPPADHTTIPPQSLVRRQVPQQIQDIDPEELAGLMALTISTALDEVPPPSPMEIVNRLLQLKSPRGHKVVWTRFDINQLFALWTNKLDRNRP